MADNKQASFLLTLFLILAAANCRALRSKGFSGNVNVANLLWASTHSFTLLATWLKAFLCRLLDLRVDVTCNCFQNRRMHFYKINRNFLSIFDDLESWQIISNMFFCYWQSILTDSLIRFSGFKLQKPSLKTIRRLFNLCRLSIKSVYMMTTTQMLQLFLEKIRWKNNVFTWSSQSVLQVM